MRIGLAGLAIVGGIAATGLATPAKASYVQSCVLDGKILDEPRVVRLYLAPDDEEVEESTFNFRVRTARPAGRADTDCGASFAGKTIPVKLNAGYARVKALRRGQRVRITFLAKDGRGMPRTETYALVGE